MIWIKHSIVFVFMMCLLQGCGIYSFSGTSVPSEAKTFSLQVQSNVSLGPPDLAEKFQQQLEDELVHRTPLKFTDTQGDLQLDGVLKQFKYMPIAPTKKDTEDQVSIDRLTIAVQMNYINPYNKDASFSKKVFSQYADMPADASRSSEEARLIDEVFRKLIKDIFNETVASW